MTPVTPRPAATVMIVRDHSADGGAPLEVFMQKRQSSMAFGGAYVFPGGAVDPSDRDSAVATPRLSPADANGRLEVDDDGLAFYLAAVRESFEEVGVLFASSGAGDATDTLRARVDADEMSLAELSAELDCVLEPERLSYVGHFVTPSTEPVRFDARFFVAELPAGQSPVGEHAEIAASEWVEPRAALERFQSGEMFLIGPTIHSLVFLAAFASVTELLTFVEERQQIPVPVVDVAWGRYLREPMTNQAETPMVTSAHGGAQ